MAWNWRKVVEAAVIVGSIAAAPVASDELKVDKTWGRVAQILLALGAWARPSPIAPSEDKKLREKRPV